MPEAKVENRVDAQESPDADRPVFPARRLNVKSLRCEHNYLVIMDTSMGEDLPYAFIRPTCITRSPKKTGDWDGLGFSHSNPTGGKT